MDRIIEKDYGKVLILDGETEADQVVIMPYRTWEKMIAPLLEGMTPDEQAAFKAEWFNVKIEATDEQMAQLREWFGDEIITEEEEAAAQRAKEGQ